MNEEHMLEWVEGRLSRIEEANRAMGTRPGVSERVRQMQANRRALQAAGVERAPAELMDRVLAALERDALLGLSNGQDVSDHPPISLATHQVKVNRGRGLHRWAPQLALAAGLLLLVGGAAYWGSVLVKPKRVGGPLATHEAAPIDLGPIAAKERPASEAAATPQTPESPTLAAASPPAATPQEMTEDRVLRLAREGRLVMRVGSRDLSRLAQVEAMDALKDGRTWRVSKSVPPEVSVAVLTPARGTRSRPSPAAPAFATMAPLVGSGAAGFPAAPALALEFARHEPRAYLVDFPDTQKALSAVKAVLADRLKATVEFVELEEPLDLPRVEDPDAVLWWTLPPSSWSQRVTVPVVVEAR